MSEAKSDTAAARGNWIDECRTAWQSLPLRWVWLILTLAWVAVFQFYGNSVLGYIETSSLFEWYWWVLTVVKNGSREWTFAEALEKDEAHMWFIPLVVAALFWMKRKEFLALPKRTCWPAVGLLVLAIALHLAGFMVQQTRLSVVGFFIGLYALMGWVWGPQWMRESLFPFFLFAFSVPMGNALEVVAFPLRTLSAELSTFISKWLLGMDVFRQGTSIISANGNFQYDVAPACSGIRSLVTLLALTTIFGYFTFNTMWKRFLVVLLAAPLAVAGNTARITGAVLVGEVFGQEAGAKVEQNLGFVTFLIALTVLLLIARWLREDPLPEPAPARMAAPSAEGGPGSQPSSSLPA